MLKASTSAFGLVVFFLIVVGLSMLTNTRADMSPKCHQLGGIYIEAKYGPPVCLKPESIIEIK